MLPFAQDRWLECTLDPPNSCRCKIVTEKSIQDGSRGVVDDHSCESRKVNLVVTLVGLVGWTRGHPRSPNV